MKLKTNLLLGVLIVFYKFECTFPFMPSCPSRVYCQGPILHTVQTMKIFDDSKQFVDMMMKFDEKKIHQNFRILMRSSKNITRNDVKRFVMSNFVLEDELERWTQEDYTPNPDILSRITVRKYKRFAKSLIPIWLTLGKKLRKEIFEENSRYSIIPVPNGFVVPGGRFREFYYWDTYWIIVGLLQSDMVKTVKGMLENFLWLIAKYGFIPNGGRIYYLNRSQPPLLLMMIEEYFKVTKDVAWLRKNIPLMETELKFWLDKKTIEFNVNNTRYTLARYNVESSSPRPESYSEDYHTCSGLRHRAAKEHCYRELKSGAESGWDFSSRWMTSRRVIQDLQVSRIIPVDLNSLLTRSFRILSDFYGIIGDISRQHRWSTVYNEWRSSLHKLMYDEEDGIWYDFNTATLSHHKDFYPSNFAPLWVNLFPERNISKPLGRKAVRYLIRHNIFMFEGGIPTSLYETGEQWDLPNAWPPLQSMIILALQRSGDPTAQYYAKRLAERWINVNLAVFDSSSVMYEKYNAEFVGVAGSGGEYEVQPGFGWSNGVILELIGEFFATKKQDLKSGSASILTIRVPKIFMITLLLMGKIT